MRNLSLVACAALLLCSACTKVKPEAPAMGNAKGGSASINPIAAENLGTPLKGTNVAWLIDPLYPNIRPLITHAPGSLTGYVAVMIDNGILNGATPINPFRFIAVDLLGRTTKAIDIATPAGQPVTTTLGRVTRYMFGLNKKLYVATESGAGGGGHLVEYDPNTQTAIDLGKPFFAKGKYLDIYMLNVGADGALYGGSFGDDGDVYTFRYNYDSKFYVDKTPINNESKYVGYISGDAQYTYASVGQNNWQLYAIHRATGEKTQIMRFNSPDERIEIFSHTDGSFAKKGATHYKLSGAVATALNNRPLTNRVLYSPYDVTKDNLPEVVWNGGEKKLSFRFGTGSESSISVPQVTSDIYPTAAMICANNTLFISASKVPEMVCYDKTGGFKYLGNYALTAHSMTLTNEGSEPTLLMGGYPKGAVLEYRVNKTWTVNTLAPGYTPPAITEQQSNPQKVTQFQDADAAGVRGAMYLSGMFYTKSGYLVAGGNNDRLTATTNRELSIGSLYKGVKRNVYLPEFSRYEYSGMCLSADSSLAYVAAESISGGAGRIFVYDPVTNTIVQQFDFPLGACPGSIASFSKDVIVGVCGSNVYLFDMARGTLIFKHDMGFSHRIYSLTIAPDGSVWINLTGTDIFTTRIIRLDIKNVNGVVNANVKLVSTLVDAQRDENTKPNRMVFVKSPSGNYDLYISGLKSLYRVSGCCTA